MPSGLKYDGACDAREKALAEHTITIHQHAQGLQVAQLLA
jgi:hypothetical protein